MELVRADGGQDHTRARRQGGQRGSIRRIRGEQRQSGARPDGIAHPRELGGISPGEGPTQLTCSAVGRLQILGHQVPSEAGGAENNEVEASFHSASSHKACAADRRHCCVAVAQAAWEDTTATSGNKLRTTSRARFSTAFPGGLVGGY